MWQIEIIRLWSALPPHLDFGRLISTCYIHCYQKTKALLIFGGDVGV